MSVGVAEHVSGACSNDKMTAQHLKPISVTRAPLPLNRFQLRPLTAPLPLIRFSARLAPFSAPLICSGRCCDHRSPVMLWLIFNFYSAPVGERSIAISFCLCVCVCVCVCLSASISLEPLDRSSRKFCADPLWPWLAPPLAALRYIMCFRFCG